MADYAVLHTATRVIRGLTTDARRVLLADETIVGPLAVQLDIRHPRDEPGWRLALDNVTLVRATIAQWRAADMDEAWDATEKERKWMELRQAVRDVRDDPTVPVSVKAWATKTIQVYG